MMMNYRAERLADRLCASYEAHLASSQVCIIFNSKNLMHTVFMLLVVKMLHLLLLPTL